MPLQIVSQRIKGGMSVFSFAACGKGLSWAGAGSREGAGPPLPLWPAAPAYSPPHPRGHGVPTHPWAVRPFPRSVAPFSLCLYSSCFEKQFPKLPFLSSNEKVELWVNQLWGGILTLLSWYILGTQLRVFPHLCVFWWDVKWLPLNNCRLLMFLVVGSVWGTECNNQKIR